MIGLALLAIGGVLIWAAFTGRAEAVVAALKLDLQQAPSAGSNSSSGGKPLGGAATGGHNYASAAAYDPGPGGQGGQFQTGPDTFVSGSYASLSEADKAAANAWANHASNTNA